MEWGVVAAILALAVSASLLFVGVLWSALIALGNKHYLVGLGILIFFPTALYYCWRHSDEAKDAARFLYPGAVLTSLCVIPVCWVASQLTSIG